MSRTHLVIGSCALVVACGAAAQTAPETHDARTESVAATSSPPTAPTCPRTPRSDAGPEMMGSTVVNPPEGILHCFEALGETPRRPCVEQCVEDHLGNEWRNEYPDTPTPPGAGFVKNGYPPPVVIQAMVRAHFGEMQPCYARALAKHPSLAGRASIYFKIDLEGRVTSARDGGSTIDDPEMIACLVERFGKLIFPKPSGGPVTVIYPILFNPD